MNKLAQEHSAYLRHAAGQQIDWQPWSEEAFEQARQEGKPIFLSSGAVWCHWCHVMAGESFENSEAAALMNELFVNIKLDRDERPDIDRRYQQAVAAMGGGSGWPLSVFLTPEKEPFFGGTYFPPEDRAGRPGFKKVLKSVSEFYRAKQNDAVQYAAQVMASLKPEILLPGELRAAMLDEAETAILSHFDREHGGFGAAPKFPMPGALEFLLRRCNKGGQGPGEAVRSTLGAMARGGFHDQLGGGFHRYSVDEKWLVPHFEKMTDDNAGLLKNYINGYALFGDERYRVVAEDIISFTKGILADPVGGFFASQDADVTFEEEGGYFTWTDEELRQALSPKEYETLSLYFSRRNVETHRDEARAVLSLGLNAAEVALKLGKSAEAAAETIRSGKAKLLGKRSERKALFVDTTLYTSLNGMMIAAYLRAFMTLGERELRDFAVKSLERILQERLIDGRLYRAPGVTAMLDDYIHLIDALLAAYEASGERKFLDQAERLMLACEEKFLDKERGGFFDTEGDVLGTRLKNIEDIPHPSANAVAISALLKLSFMTGNESYRLEAERALKIFSGLAPELGIHAGSYFCGLDAYFHMTTLTVEAAPESALASRARELAGRTFAAIRYDKDRGRVIPCIRGACLAPVTDAEALTRLNFT